MTVAIMNFNSWFPASRDVVESEHERLPGKKMVLFTILFLAVIMALNVFHTFGISLELKIGGYGSAGGLLKTLIP